VEMMEFKDLAEAEKWRARMRKDDTMTRFREEFMPLIEPATHSMNVWNSRVSRGAKHDYCTEYECIFEARLLC
jgi:hypothetical protein